MFQLLLVVFHFDRRIAAALLVGGSAFRASVGLELLDSFVQSEPDGLLSLLQVSVQKYKTMFSARHYRVAFGAVLTRSQPLLKGRWRSMHGNQDPDYRIELAPVLLASIISYALNGGTLAAGSHDQDALAKRGRLEDGQHWRRWSVG